MKAAGPAEANNAAATRLGAHFAADQIKAFALTELGVEASARIVSVRQCLGLAKPEAELPACFAAHNRSLRPTIAFDSMGYAYFYKTACQHLFDPIHIVEHSSVLMSIDSSNPAHRVLLAEQPQHRASKGTYGAQGPGPAGSGTLVWQ